MKASDYKGVCVPVGRLEDELVKHLETEAGKAELEQLDKHWEEVMELAVRYGLLVDAYGGVATLCTHLNYIEEVGIEREASRLRAQRVELGEAD